jgi:hypothetical protein
VDALADEEGESASPEIVEGGSRRGVATPIVVVRAATTVALVFPLALALTLAFVVIVRGGGRGGEGPSEDSVVVAKVDVVAVVMAAEGALFLRAWSRTQRHVPGPLSCLA